MLNGNRVKMLLPVIGSFILASCAATGPKFEQLTRPQKQSAVVYFVRPATHTLAARAVNIAINHKPFAELRGNGYTVATLRPGHYEFEQSFDTVFGDYKALSQVHKIEAELKGGQTYFAAFEAGSTLGSGETSYVPVMAAGIAVPISVGFDLRFGFLPEGTALKILKHCRYEKPIAKGTE